MKQNNIQNRWSWRMNERGKNTNRKWTYWTLFLSLLFQFQVFFYSLLFSILVYISTSISYFHLIHFHSLFIFMLSLSLPLFPFNSLSLSLSFCVCVFHLNFPLYSFSFQQFMSLFQLCLSLFQSLFVLCLFYDSQQPSSFSLTTQSVVHKWGKTETLK